VTALKGKWRQIGRDVHRGIKFSCTMESFLFNVLYINLIVKGKKRKWKRQS